MLRHRRLAIWEQKLKAVFDSIDDFLEDRFGGRYPLHPSRARRGSTGNKEQDGLFNIGASYSLGLGSEHGAGYVIEVRLATLSHIDAEVRAAIEAEVIAQLKQRLPETFPGTDLRVDRDGSVYKIYGNLSLGTV